MPSSVVIATAELFGCVSAEEVFSEVLRRSVHPLPTSISIGSSAAPTSVPDLCTCCCPLRLAADDADFMNSHLGQAQSASILIHVMLMLLVFICCSSPSFGHFCVAPQPPPPEQQFVFVNTSQD